MMLLHSHGVPKTPSFVKMAIMAVVHLGFRILTKKE
jgi:hypothetical protein